MMREPQAEGASTPRVLFVIPGDGAGSSMIFVRRQAESVRRAGVAVHCFYLRSRTSPGALARDLLRFRREAARFEPDIVHAHYGTVTALFAALAAPRTPLVITYRGSDLNRLPREDGLRPAAARLMSQLAALRAARIVCVSEDLLRRLWWRRGRVIVLPTGVDTGVFRPEPRQAARDRLGWHAGERVVLFNAGRNPANKRPDLAQAAAALARQQAPDLRLEIMDGGVPPALVPTLMNAADCLLVASDAEGSPTVVQEALACGLPVVSVEVGDVAERLRGVTHSRIVARDPAAIGAALAELTGTGLRSNGPQEAAGISLERIAERLRRLYEEVCSRGYGKNGLLTRAARWFAFPVARALKPAASPFVAAFRAMRISRPHPQVSRRLATRQAGQPTPHR